MASVDARKVASRLSAQVASVFVGDEEIVHDLLIGFLAGLHVLIEDIPGVGKTTLALSLARSAGLDFGRVQFTPDILPGDILGMTVWSAERREFLFKPGAIMHQFVLADEINRASARTQSSLLEAMQEEAVTVDGVTHRIPSPFFVIATQNPVSFAGTFLLPESQSDRFGLSFSIGYPSDQDELVILERFKESNPLDFLEAVSSGAEVLAIRELVGAVFVDPTVKEFLVKIASSTRQSGKVKLGMSPRGTRHLLRASQCEALISGRDYVIPEDVVRTAPIVVPHRLMLSGEAKVENVNAARLVEEVMGRIPLPTGV